MRADRGAPGIAAVHAEIERLIKLAEATAKPGQARWYERQRARWAANRPAAASTQVSLTKRPDRLLERPVGQLAAWWLL